jgi:HAD superfamily hydrolase (TIGR01458 family)
VPDLDVTSIRLFLFDVDGVFLAGKTSPRLISGRRAISALRERDLPFRLLTNTSTHPRSHLARTLWNLGVHVESEEIHSALETTVGVAARRFSGGRCLVVGEAGMRALAAESGLEVVDEAPADVVLVGLTREADYQLLSAAARCLLHGAALLGAHRNKLWKDESGRALSCGPWVAALEFATGITAETFGKPSRAFFDEAREPLGVPAEATLMIGDDAAVDVRGAQEAGLRAGLVLTGKTSRDDLARLGIDPDLVFEQVDDLAQLL